MTIIMQMTAELVPMLPLSRKNSGTPIAAPAPKHMSCRFVRLSMTFVLTALRSLGTGTYAMFCCHLRQCALKIPLAREPVLNSVKQSSTV